MYRVRICNLHMTLLVCTMDPPRTCPGGRKKNRGLSAKQYTKITGTIASVRRN
ncbi:uncharacterized protein BJ212DRAFT_1378219, partial [Suillus subaureus]